MCAEQLHDIDLRFRPELGERDIDPSTPRSPAAQRHVTKFLIERGRVAEFLEANDIRLTDEQIPTFLEALEVEFLAAMRLLARRAGRDFGRDKRPEVPRVEGHPCPIDCSQGSCGFCASSSAIGGHGLAGLGGLGGGGFSCTP